MVSDAQRRYGEYLKSAHWNYLRRVGGELLEDLEILCESCHGLEHGVKPPEWYESIRFIGRESDDAAHPQDA